MFNSWSDEDKTAFISAPQVMDWTLDLKRYSKAARSKARKKLESYWDQPYGGRADSYYSERNGPPRRAQRLSSSSYVVPEDALTISSDSSESVLMV
ncbi:hypothetical protein BP6252_04839 [Coleophoma cylindrospora]|uniref:Uncharacterized protein n=1 Tax=Coleophoma cylindrospora TaxID=1849047 RepID=A0A3D8S271_9HELO|nr:hypothetical protein BP6252_04839 [Coleophoma cylindrospora]